MKNRIEQAVNESFVLKEQLLTKSEGISFIQRVSDLIHSKLAIGGKVFVCGNGGSAANSQHFAAELVGRFMKERRALPAIALTTDTSILTAIANDYDYKSIFSRQIEALCTSDDIVIGISTSGNSANVLEAFRKAHLIGAVTVALLGNTGGGCLGLADYSYVVASSESARIQEVHILIEHLICELVEQKIMNDAK